MQTAAVEALIKGDTQLIGTVTLLKERLDYLKSSFDDNLLRVVKEIQSSNEKLAISLKLLFDDSLVRIIKEIHSSNEKLNSKMSVLSQNVHDLNLHVVNASKHIGAVKMIMENEKKQRSLERALNLIELGSFDYYILQEDNWPNDYTRNSSDLAKSVIGWFMIGQGAYLPSDLTLTVVVDHDDHAHRNTTIEVWRTMSSDEKDAMAKEFADKFASQIKTLIKHKPRLVKYGIASFSIFYE